MTTTRLTLNGTVYAWHELDSAAADSDSWLHSGIALTRDGDVVAADPDGLGIRILDPVTGERHATIPVGGTDIHCITPEIVDDVERFWLVDHGHKFVPDGRCYDEHLAPSRVSAITTSGAVVAELRTPDRDAEKRWRPTSLVIMSDGRTWVADGYGQSLLHCFDRTGAHLFTVDGSDSGVPFAVPHGLLINTRGSTEEIYVADRGNRRIVVLDGDGGFLRTVGDGLLTSPSSLALLDDHLVVTELFGSIVVLDANDQIVDRVGDESAHDQPHWPNVLDGDRVVRPHVLPGCLRSPHGIATDSSGRIYLTEWFIGGRVICLTPTYLAYPEPIC